MTGRLTPEALQRLTDAEMRGAGLSGAKLASLRDLSQKVLDGAVAPGDARRWGDDELIAQLTSVRGIGPWTAEMYLMFQLRRLDVWPVGDLGVRQGYGLAWGIDPSSGRPPARPPRVTASGPYRTVACALLLGGLWALARSGADTSLAVRRG